MDYSWRLLRGNPIVLALLAFWVAGCGVARAEIADDWASFKSDYIMADGRVVDSPDGMSHARSQGIALLGAVAADDRDAFSRILNWTQANLDIRGDGLYAREWRPEAGVPARQDAADGDILIAWALVRAQARWHVPEFKDRALRSIAGIHKHLLREHGGFLLILPATEGYDGPLSTTINLADWIFPALRSFATIDPSPQWGRLEADGIKLLEQARFGPSHLPTDWIDIDGHGGTLPAAGHPPHFGAEAQQVPLFLAWGLGGTPQLPDLLEPFLKRWEHDNGTLAPSWIDVTTGAIASDRAGPGLDAVLAAARAAFARTRPVMPALSTAHDYRAASLILLGEISVMGAN